MPLPLRCIFLATTFLLFAAPLKAEPVTSKYGDLTLNGYLKIAEGKSLKDGVILMTHGTLAHGKMETIASLQNTFAERGWNSLAITLSLGLDKREGFYACETPHTHKHTDALDEIGQWLAWLKKHGAAKAVLFGHSRGGNQTAWFAAERPDPFVSHTVLLAPMTWSEGRAIKDYADRYEKLLKRVIAKSEKAINDGKGGRTIDYMSILYCPCADATPESLLSYHRPDSRLHTPYLLDKIETPVLVIAGSADKVVTGLPEAVGPMAEKSDKLSFVLVPEANHYFLDLFTEDIADAMEEFFTK